MGSLQNYVAPNLSNQLSSLGVNITVSKEAVVRFTKIFKIIAAISHDLFLFSFRFCHGQVIL